MALVGLLAIAGCSGSEPRRRNPGRPTPARRSAPTPTWDDRPAARPPDPYQPRSGVAAPPTAEGVIIPADAQLDEAAVAPTPTATGIVIEEPTPAPLEEPTTVAPSASPAAASIPQSESLLPRIAPGTPGNQAAALRLVEEGRLRIDAGNYDQALERLERAVSIDPSNAYGYYYLARVKYLRREMNQAVGFAGRAVALSSRADRGWQSRAYTLQGEVFEGVGRYRDARDSYAKALQADATNLSARVGLVRVSPSPPAAPAGE